METKPVTGASLGTIAYPYTEFMGVRLYAMGNSPTVRCIWTVGSVNEVADTRIGMMLSADEGFLKHRGLHFPPLSGAFYVLGARVPIGSPMIPLPAAVSEHQRELHCWYSELPSSIDDGVMEAMMWDGAWSLQEDSWPLAPIRYLVARAMKEARATIASA